MNTEEKKNSSNEKENKHRSIGAIWRNRKKIWQGFINWFCKKDPIEELYQERLSICNTCSHMNRDGSKCAVPLTQPCCGICGCSLNLLLRSPDSSCEAGKWYAKGV